jgi:hypothetical protein
VVVSADGTPFAAAPIQVGDSLFTSGDDGRFVAQVLPEQDASISSGLKAIKIEEINGEERETLPGSGAEIASIAVANGGVIQIAVSRRVKAEPLCLAYSADGSQEVLWFRYTNRFGETLEVADQQLNSLLSPSGLPYPVSKFESTNQDQPDGFFGFEWALDYFKDIEPVTNKEIIRAVWKLLGKEVSLEQPKEEVPLCSESGDLRGCLPLPAHSNGRIFEAASRTVNRLAKECEKAKIRGIWKPQGTFRIPYYKRAGTALRRIREILNQIDREGLLCRDLIPAGCSEQTYPKSRLLEQFDSILKVKLPKGLRHLVKRYPGERRYFIAELNKQPDRYIKCPR